jgi:glycosyltransferase involved in cell wall biosynthesis
MMRVALISRFYPPYVGGVESAVESLGYGLADLGCEVTVFTTTNNAATIDRPGLQIKTLPHWDTRSISAAVRGYDITHVHGYKRLFTSAAVVLVRPNLTAITMHGGVAGLARYKSRDRMVRRLYDVALGYSSMRKAYRRIVCLNAEEYEGLKAAGLPSRQLCILPNALPASAFDRPQLPRCDSFLYLGRIHPEKSIEYIIDSIAATRSKLTVAGSGEAQYLAFLRDYAERRNAEVSFVGAVNGDQKWRLLGSSRALVLATLWEGQSISVLEAMAVGTPVIVPSSAASGVVFGGETGFVYDRADPMALARLLTAFPDEPQALMRRTERARKLVEASHSPRVVAHSHMEMYQQFA